MNMYSGEKSIIPRSIVRIFQVLPKQMDFPQPWAVYMLFHMHFAQVLHTISICLTLSLAIWRYIAIRLVYIYVHIHFENRNYFHSKGAVLIAKVHTLSRLSHTLYFIKKIKLYTVHFHINNNLKTIVKTFTIALRLQKRNYRV